MLNALAHTHSFNSFYAVTVTETKIKREAIQCESLLVSIAHI